MTQVRCKKCGTAVHSGEVRYVSPSEFYCDTCFLGHSGKMRAKATRSEIDYEALPARKEKCVCAKCGFVSRFSPEQERRSCGYCGSDKVGPDPDSAAKLIAESDEFDLDE